MRFLSTLALASALAACGSDEPKDELQVETDLGILRGAKVVAVRAFRGIPFAAPPVGADRWRAPQPPLRSRPIPPSLGRIPSSRVWTPPPSPPWIPRARSPTPRLLPPTPRRPPIQRRHG